MSLRESIAPLIKMDTLMNVDKASRAQGSSALWQGAASASGPGCTPGVYTGAAQGGPGGMR